MRNDFMNIMKISWNKILYMKSFTIWLIKNNKVLSNTKNNTSNPL